MAGNAHRRRFVAGAVCPRCALQDKIVIDLDTDQRECVACGFAEDRPGQERPGQERPGSAGLGQERPGPDPAGELPTRVSRAAARRVETAAETVTIIDASGDGDSSGGDPLP